MRGPAVMCRVSLSIVVILCLVLSLSGCASRSPEAAETHPQPEDEYLSRRERSLMTGRIPLDPGGSTYLLSCPSLSELEEPQFCSFGGDILAYSQSSASEGYRIKLRLISLASGELLAETELESAGPITLQPG